MHHEVDRGRSNGCLRAMTVMETTATVLMPKSRETNIRQLRGVDGRECNNVSFLQKIPIRALYTVTENDRDSKRSKKISNYITALFKCFLCPLERMIG